MYKIRFKRLDYVTNQMGNLNTGIKEEGRMELIMCNKCGKQFEAKVGVITIKGPSPAPQFCKECHHDIVQNLFQPQGI